MDQESSVIHGLLTTCILNLDKQTNSSNLCLQIVDLKYGINVPDILQT